jgi:hypothetical protein
MVGEFVEKMTEVLQKLGIDGGRMVEQNLRNILDEFAQEFRAQLAPAQLVQQGPENQEELNEVEVNRVYNAHWFGGGGHRVPADWRFPRCGVFDVFRQWHIGDSVRHIIPLRGLTKSDFDYLDLLPLSEEELHGRRGKYANQRRNTRKTFSDLKFICEFIEDRVVKRGIFPDEITPLTVDAMFIAVSDVFTIQERSAQTQWTSVVNTVRRRFPGYVRVRVRPRPRRYRLQSQQ